MTAQIIVSVVSATRSTTQHSPTETSYFTVPKRNPYNAHNLPAGWCYVGTAPTGTPYRKAVTVELPEYIHDTPQGLRSDYSATDGNSNMVFAECSAVRVTDSIETAIDAAIKTLALSAPTASGKRESIHAQIVTVSPLFDSAQP